MWLAVAYFWAAFAINAALLWLQQFYVKQSPGLLVLAYRFLQSFLFANLFILSLLIAIGPWIGAYLKNRTSSRRDKILSWIAHQTGRQNTKQESISDATWSGTIGFFHPFCNAGGGGERVLWAAIKATQDRYPNGTCVVYTGDHDATKTEILERVRSHFNIELDTTRIFFLYLSQRKWVLASMWPHVTLLGQSLGSLVLVIDAFSLLVPDVYIDTMGYAFTFALAKWLFPKMPTGAYIHYPTISTDMLGSLNGKEGQGLNAGTGKGVKGMVKRVYWILFAKLYSWVGSYADVVVTNSSWTRDHIQAIWGASRNAKDAHKDITVLFPPVAVDDLIEAISVDAESEKNRENILVYIAQFRPEKNHTMLLQAYADLVHGESAAKDAINNARLLLIGSVRDDDDKKRVYELRLLAHELKIKESVQFETDASWPDILNWLGKSSVGINGMWNEHFGIGVVEYQAAGLISVVNNSGGPKLDIVIDIDGAPTGFHASTTKEYSAAFLKALELPPTEKVAMRERARKSATRFNQQRFTDGWIKFVERLVILAQDPSPKKTEQDQALWMAGMAYLTVTLFEVYRILK